MTDAPCPDDMTVQIEDDDPESHAGEDIIFDPDAPETPDGSGNDNSPEV